MIYGSRTAWNERRGLSKEQSKRFYIENIKAFMPNVKIEIEEDGEGEEESSDDDIFMKEGEKKVKKKKN